MSDFHDSTTGPASRPPGSALPEELQHLIHTGAVRPPTEPGCLGFLDRYRLLKLLGEGGMGVVYAAQAPESADLVAVKLLKHRFTHSSQAVRAFVREARHMQSLGHPHIQSVIDVAPEGGLPYFVSPFRPLGSLADQRGAPLGEEEIVLIAKGVASALEFAHSRGIIHRDVKPANVLLRGRGDPCLADFGLGRTLYNDSALDPSQIHRVGTPAYMSPGVAAGSEEDTRGDIYGFGATLYELLCGRPPYQGNDAASVMQQVIQSPPPRIVAVNPKASRRLALIAETAMARELRRRYASMSDVLADLERVQSGRPPLGTRPPTWLDSRWIAAAACVALGLLAIVARWHASPSNGRGERAAAAQMARPTAREELPQAGRLDKTHAQESHGGSGSHVHEGASAEIRPLEARPEEDREQDEQRARALSPAILDLLRPLTTPDYAQPTQILGLMATGEMTTEKQPVSLTRLRSLGALDANESGLKKLAILNSSRWTSRPRWNMRYEAPEPNLWSAEQREMIVSTQALLRECGEILVEEGHLAP